MRFFGCIHQLDSRIVHLDGSIIIIIITIITHVLETSWKAV